MNMAAPNPYLIYIELFYPDGSRPNQNQIARVNAYDVNGAVVTPEGQSGFNPNTGGWHPVYLQNIAAFSPPRDQPNLKFEVVSTAEAIVHTTQVFSNIPNESTVRITIGVGAVLVGGGSTPSWQVSGHVRRENGVAFSPGTVVAYDLTNGSVAQLGTATIAADGSYSITYSQASFANNGVPHAQPNLQVKAFDSMGQPLVVSSVVMGATTNQVIELTVPDSEPGTVQRRVFGNVTNNLELAVSGITVQAFHVAWTASGLQETPLGTATSGAAGAYEILYQPSSAAGGANPCATPAGDVNLLVYAKDTTTQAVLFTSPVLFDARQEERVDPVVDRIAVGADSEYQLLSAAISTCLGTTEAERLFTLNQLSTRSELLTFVSQSSGQSEALIRAYVSAWLIATEINTKIPVGPTGLSRPMSPEVIYGLLRIMRKKDLQELLNVPPDEFFDAIVRGVHQRLVAASLENDLFPNAAFGNKSLLDDWRVVLAKLMNATTSPSPQGSWQGPLLELVFPSTILFPQVPSLTQTLFGTDATTHNAVMPAGIVAGDLLVVLFTNDGSATVTTPSGWTQLFSAANSTAVRLSAYKKVAAGTESGTNVNFVTSAAEQGAAQIYVIAKDRWSGSLADVVAAATAATGTSVNIDPPSFTTPWAATKTLWIACAGHDREFALSSSPANYTNSLRSNSSATSTSATGLSARREFENATDNPGNFVIGTAEEWVAQTIAIKPSPVFVPSAKKELVVNAYFDAQGSLQAALATLVSATTLTQPEADNVTFVFEMYEAASRYFPIVAAVYPRKATTGWKTIRDLASVPLEAATGSDHWIAYAFNSLSFSNAQFPADIQGSNNDDKGRVYAARLQQTFGGVGPQEAFSAELTVAANATPALGLGPVRDFLAAQPTFSLETTNVDRFLSEKGITLPAADLAKLKQVQRVYRIAPTFGAGQALITAGLDSVVKITSMTEGEFIARNEQAVGGLTAAQNIYRTAAHYSSELFATLIKFHHNLNVVGGISAIPGPVDFTVLDPTEGLLAPGAITPGGAADPKKFPNWVTLFGDLNQCACKHCQTILSPGAYLADLLEFCDGTPKRVLFDRRPDLEQIELTCENTERTLPYIDLVNEVLESLVHAPSNTVLLAGGDTVPGVFDAASGGDSAAIAKVRKVLTDLGYTLADRTIVTKSALDQPSDANKRDYVILDDAWRFTVRKEGSLSGPYSVHAWPQTSATNDSLEMFPEHFNDFTNAVLSQTVFPFHLPLELGREEIEIFLRAKNVRPHEVREAFSLLDPPSKLTDQDISLSHLRLTTNEAGAILGEGKLPFQLWGFNAATVTPADKFPRPDRPTETVSGDWKAVLALVPVFLHRSGLRYEELLDLLDTKFVQKEAANVHGVHVAAPAEQLVQCNINEFQLAHLNEATLLRMSFFIRLWRKLGWTMRELDHYLMAMEGGNLPAVDPAGTTFASKLVRLSMVQRLIEELKLPPRTVTAFWTPIETRRSPQNPKSLFDETFLDGDSTQPEVRHLDVIARGGTFNLADQDADEDIKSHVRMALRVKAKDFDLLWNTFVGTAPSTVLSEEPLTAMFRVASICSALKISIEDYFDLSSITELVPVTPGSPFDLRTGILATHAGIREYRVARSIKVPPDELLYLLTDEHDEGDSFVPTQQDFERAAQRLATASAEIAGSDPEQPSPDAVVLGAALARVMPADKVGRAIGIIEEPLLSGPANSQQVAFLVRYFGVFTGWIALAPAAATAAANALLTNLAALTFLDENGDPEPDLPARHAFVWNILHAFLLERTRTTTAIAVAAELMGTSEDIANTLLTQSLRSLHVPPLASALDDWKALVNGGFSFGPVGSALLQGAPEPVVQGGAPGQRLGTLIAPKNAEYRFVASVAGPFTGTPVSLYIDLDGERTQLEATPGAVAGEFVFSPVTLRAGSVNPLEFNFTGTAGSQVTLRWRLDNSDPVLIPATAIVPFAQSVYLKLYKAVRLVKGLGLKKPELEQFLFVTLPLGRTLPDALPLDPAEPRLPWAALSDFAEVLSLNRSVRLKTTTLFELFRDPALLSVAVANPNDPVVKKIADQTDWKPEDIVAVLALFSGAVPSWDDPTLWRVLKACFAIVLRLDIRADIVQSALVVKPPSLGIAAMLRNVFRGQFTKDTWKEIFKPLRDPLRRRQRDALVGYLTTRAIANPAPSGGPSLYFHDANDLFAFLLLDVEMEPDTLISRIKLALNSVQLLVHRVFLGLEDARVFAALAEAKDQWTWMERFRVWEANRKVFLFPENYIEPELRDDKTDFFKSFEDELSQGTLTHETAVSALTSYLDKMKEIANLEVVGSFAENANASGTSFTLHVVGRTRTQARAYYYRTFEARQGHEGFWSPWQEVSVEINADVVIPVVVDGRLHVFWPKVISKERPRPGGDESDDPSAEYIAEIRLMWSEYLPKKKKWSKPRISKSHATDTDSPTPFQRDIGEDQPPTDNYHFRARFDALGVQIQVFRTNVPTAAFTEEMRTRTTRHVERHRNPITGQTQTETTTISVQHPVPVYASLDPIMLGSFRLSFTGDDAYQEMNVELARPAAERETRRAFTTSGPFESSRTEIIDNEGPVVSNDTGLGANYPIGTVLRANAAVEVGFPVNTLTSRDALELAGAVPFFKRTPGTFRIFETNFGYVPGARLDPFFYETSQKGLFAAVKSISTERRPPALGSGGLTNGIIAAANALVTSLSQQRVVRATFTTFNHPLVQEFEKRLHDFGVEGLMNRLTQALPCVDDRYYANYYYNYYGNLYLGYHIARDNQAWGATQRLFESEHEPDTRAIQGAYPLPTVEFGYGTPFGVYNWELFFHAPMLVAERMKQDLKFEDAMRWYHYVFDPKQTLNTYERTRRFTDFLPKGSRYWNYLPFFANYDQTDSLLETLGLKKTTTQYEHDQFSRLIDDWRRNPFRPHLIARTRTVAYQKHVVMKYLDNLIAWADDLFRQDTFETINEATQLYVLADEILGQRPDRVEPLTGSPRHTYRELKARGLDAFSNAIVEVESLLVGNRPQYKSVSRSNALPKFTSSLQQVRRAALQSFFFRIPRNERLDQYWSIVQDRLFKIRNSMNIDGVKRQLALFEPPIDPALLVRAVAAGLDLGSVVSQLNTPLPHYRYTVWIQKATELTKEVQSFGAAFLAALEKRDAEDLALLRQSHEIRMLELVRTVKQQQVREAEGNIRALDRSRELAEERRNEYRRRARVSAREQSQIDSLKTANIFDIASGAAHTLAALFAIIPDASTGTDGPAPITRQHIPIGKALTQVTTAFAHGFSTLATVNKNEAALAGIRAGYDRRWEDWKLQERLAQKEMTQIDQQIAVANIRLSIAEKELENHEIQMEQASEMREFLRDKFTNRELYHWMAGEISRTYQSAYRLAFNAAKTAERTFGFELGIEDPAFIQFDYRDSLREGLLAGEKLLLDLKRLEVAYCERNKRELEVQKSISLAVINGDELQKLRETGSCEFEVPEVLFDLDFPGHYFRRIKGVRLTIPCVTGPHTSVSATLSLVGSNFRRDATIADADEYPYQGADDPRFVHDPVGIQSIATGTAQGDSGLFEFNFRDERYLPFEGAGAVSRWRLELPDSTRQFDYHTISDVVVQMSYTARQAGGLLKMGAEVAIRAGLNHILKITAADSDDTGLVRAISLKKEFPDVFHRLLSSDSEPITLSLSPEHFPFVLRSANFRLELMDDGVVKVHVVTKPGAEFESPALSVKAEGAALPTPLEQLSLQEDATVIVDNRNLGTTDLVPDWEPQEWTLAQTGLTTDNVEDIVFIAKYTVLEGA
jgi:hypothetical protein